ncbi:MAG: hypothetical protein WC045_04150 [Patescibacteria group bacterium]
MKTDRFRILLVSAVFFTAHQASAAQKGKVHVSGVFGVSFGDAVDRVSQVQTNINIQLSKKTGVFIRTETTRRDMDRDWLKMVALSRGKVTIGRISMLEGWSLPKSQDLRTANWPRIPAAFFGNGVQLHAKIGGFGLQAELGGSPNGTISRGSWGETNATLRLAKSNKKGTMAGILRYNDNHEHQLTVNVDYTVGPKIFFRGVAYFRNSQGKVQKGGYLLIERRINKHFRFHAQTDWKNGAPAINTIGLGIYGKGDNHIVFDWETGAQMRKTTIGMIVTF